MRILVTNDDGIDLDRSPRARASDDPVRRGDGHRPRPRVLRRRRIGRRAAPDPTRGATGASRRGRRGVDRERPTRLVRDVLAARRVRRPFDLVVSGINPGANVGRASTTRARSGLPHGTQRRRQRRGRQPGGRRLRRRGPGLGRDVANQKWESPPRWRPRSSPGSSPTRATPVVVNVNVPNLELDEIAGWQIAEVGAEPPRAMPVGQLVPTESRTRSACS